MPFAEPTPQAWSRLYSGPNADVWIHVKCMEELNELDRDERKKIHACMDSWYCQMEKTSQIPPEKLVHNEGTARAGGKERRVMAFKHHQGRVYGVEGSVDGKRAFFAATAVVKKRNKVLGTDVQRAVNRVQEAAHTVPGAKV